MISFFFFFLPSLLFWRFNDVNEIVLSTHKPPVIHIYVQADEEKKIVLYENVK